MNSLCVRVQIQYIELGFLKMVHYLPTSNLIISV